MGEKNLPKFPPKIIIGNTSKENVDKRRRELQEYFDALMLIVNFKDTQVVKDFFDYTF
jgi:hypothetical protein